MAPGLFALPRVPSSLCSPALLPGPVCRGSARTAPSCCFPWRPDSSHARPHGALLLGFQPWPRPPCSSLRRPILQAVREALYSSLHQLGFSSHGARPCLLLTGAPARRPCSLPMALSRPSLCSSLTVAPGRRAPVHLPVCAATLGSSSPVKFSASRPARILPHGPRHRSSARPNV